MTVTVHFSPDGKHILSATEADVILLADWYDYDDIDPGGMLADGHCIARVSRELYFDAMKSWLDHKASYNRGGEYAGKGRITLEDLTPLSEGAYVSAHLIEQAPKDLDMATDEGIGFFSRRVPVPHFRAADFEVEMESG